ncbi:MAG: hypothetical protein DSZ28_07935 [Thiothrix sp.]|nr:MAG: hypothetical protein DSZ28_07935 [Thiothrix sp.]
MTNLDSTDKSAEDIAWVSFLTPLSSSALVDFCQKDIERLLRINPFLEFKEWRDFGDNRFHFIVRNLSQADPFELDTECTYEIQPTGLKLEYKNGLKLSTIFQVESADKGSKLTITDYYNPDLSEEEKWTQLGEVDKSLQVWASDLQQYLIRWNKWARFTPWRWYMTKIWQPMKPTARRITYMLLWISLVEIALILLGIGIYFTAFF